MSISELKINEVKKYFLNRRKTQFWLGKKKAAMLARLGGFCRRVAQRSMRRRKGPSRPGQPPHAHKYSYLRDYVMFAYMMADEQVVVGPIRLESSDYYSKPLPAVHEFGGVFRKWRERGFIAFPERPYMRPALVETIRNLEKIAGKDGIDGSILGNG
ncbi:MAG: hypothetical protein KatS3mg105_5019 [Gemmatales bacterium]|nr:MAG: hypothetical protein KatS3mg105_5019 [Gemmatales bacterium]